MHAAGALGELDRVVVIGSSGAGKSEFSRGLAARLSSHHIELDALHWGPNWTERSPAEFRASVESAIECDRWIVDGNYGVIRDVVWPREAAIVWLNFDFATVFGRVVSRATRRAFTGERLYSGNRETFSRSFLSRDSILWWVVTTYRRRRREYAELCATGRYPGLRWLEFRRPREAAEFLIALERGA